MKEILLALNHCWASESPGICESLRASVPCLLGRVMWFILVQCVTAPVVPAPVREQERSLCSGNKYLSCIWRLWTKSHLATSKRADVCTVTGRVKKSPTKWTLLFSIFQCLGDLLVEPQAEKKNPSWVEMEIFHETVDRASPLMIIP